MVSLDPIFDDVLVWDEVDDIDDIEDIIEMGKADLPADLAPYLELYQIQHTLDFSYLPP